LQREEVLKLLEESGAILRGHFRLHSGLHSDVYVQSALVLEHPERAEVLCGELASLARGWKPEVVVGPAVGAIVLAYEVAKQLGVRGIYAERVDGKMTIRRGFRVAEGERVLIVEDTVTKWGSVKEVAAAVEELGGKVVGAVCLVDRSGGAGLGFPSKALVSVDMATYAPEECPMCGRGESLETPGSSYLRGGKK